MYDVLVLGGGPAGTTAALRARELGASVALVERDRMGGTCTNDGCVPTRVLAKAARLLRDARQLQDYGIDIEPPRLDFPQLLRRTRGIIDNIQAKKQLIPHLEKAGVDVWTGRGAAHFVDDHTVYLEDGTRLQGKSIIICVGGHARRLPFPGAELALTYSDVWSLPALPTSMAVVGAAATGCQLASVFSDFGVQVHLLDIAPRLLPGEDEAVSRAIRAGFTQRNIDILTGIAGVDRLERAQDNPPGLRLFYAEQESGIRREQSLDVDSVVFAVGWPGNVDQLGLDAAGVAHDRSYIQVDDYLRTSQPHIFAAGDINGRVMLVQSASYEARVAAENAVLEPPFRHEHGIVPHGGFTDPEYGCVGLTEEQARAGQDITVATVPYSDLDRAVIDGRTEGFCKLIAARRSRKVLGAHIVGEQATEIAQLVAAGMAADVQVDQLADLELAYPTFTAIVGLAARRLVAQMRRRRTTASWRDLTGLPMAEWEINKGGAAPEKS
jgi:pyruvate/2-oxoglutarate dehydrogenase complex dihydrolipoamide dehydrogenase (E3) component